MTTKLLYQTDPYLTEFTARVLDHQSGGVLFDRMAFFPGAGGQPADTGSVSFSSGQARVSGFERREDDVAVLLDGPLPPIGEEVHCTIDWERRYALMRTHTSLHLLAGVVGRDYGGVIVSRSMQPLRGRIDFELEVAAELPRHLLEEMLRHEIVADRPVTVSFLTLSEFLARPDLIRTKTNRVPDILDKIRVVEIEGLDRQADGGTHVARTSEVGGLHITAEQSRGKGKRRLRIQLDPAQAPHSRRE
jgi:misacylated tRNA(Ala) deacylase